MSKIKLSINKVEANQPIAVHKWDKFIGAYLINVETCTNVNDFLKNWNNRIHVWLKYYVSERLSGVGNRLTSAQYCKVFMVSAFWHGFSPMYYVSFFCIGLGSFAHKDMYQMAIFFEDVP